MAYVIGDPIAHSMSPLLHNTGFSTLKIDARMKRMKVTKQELPKVLDKFKKNGTLGASVTTPLKEELVELVDEITPRAAAIGAINCLQFKDGLAIGHNTDAEGYWLTISREEVTLQGVTTKIGAIEPDSQKMILLGTGGAARAIGNGLAHHGITPLFVSRTPSEEQYSWDEIAKVVPQSIGVIDCTSLGLSPETENDYPVALEEIVCRIPHGGFAGSLIYHRESAWCRAAEQCGNNLTINNGKWMLFHQALLAFEIWTGKKAPSNAMAFSLFR